MHILSPLCWDWTKGLLDKMILKWKSFRWTRVADYENTTFWCRICHIPGHLRYSCPHARAHASCKKWSISNYATWKWGKDDKNQWTTYSKKVSIVFPKVLIMKSYHVSEDISKDIDTRISFSRIVVPFIPPREQNNFMKLKSPPMILIRR